MIKFFRHIRYNLMETGKTGKPALPASLSGRQAGRYFKYAIGEIILVVIGILIALWINNLNTEHQQSKERKVLITNLKQELNENLKEFENRHNKLMINNKNLIKVLNYSSGYNNNESLDSIKIYLTKSLVFNSVKISNSRLSSAKSSGKFSLISEDLANSFAQYELSLNNYREFLDQSTYTLDDDWSELVIRFNSLEGFHNYIYTNTTLHKHPQYFLKDEALIKYLKDLQTYKTLHKYYTKSMVEKGWLKEVMYRIETTIKTIEQSND